MDSVLTESVSRVSQTEKDCKDYFGVDLRIKYIILNDAPTSKNSHTTVFRTDHDAIYALCSSDSPLILADIKTIIRLMGMKAELFLPPYADSSYFFNFGQKAFLDIFPGRKAGSDQELSYYKTLAPYSPALVRISEVNGEIRRYDKIWQEWQSAIRFSYLHTQVQ
jgi:hypothetical protein